MITDKSTHRGEAEDDLSFPFGFTLSRRSYTRITAALDHTSNCSELLNLIK